MATPRARGGMSLTMSPPIKRSPLVCFSSPQMMRRNVVLPQPDGPEQHHELAVRHRQRDAVDGGDLAEFLDDVPGQYRSH